MSMYSKAGKRRQGIKHWPVVLVAVALSLAACGGGDVPRSVDRRSLTAADVTSVREAVDALRKAPTGEYELVQSLRADADADAQTILTRKGSYDRGKRLHQVEVFADNAEGDATSLTFLSRPREVLMRNPAFTARHGKTWTRLPADQLLAVGAGPATTPVEPPGLDVAAAAEDTGEVVAAQQGIIEYELVIPQAAAIELVANAGAAKLSQLTGLQQEELPAVFTGTMPISVVLTDDGALQSLSADLRPLLQRAVEVAKSPIDGFADGSLLVDITWRPNVPVRIEVPAASDVGSA